MKLPKETKRYCPYCKKHTLQSLAIAKQRGRSSAHPLSRGGSFRLESRGLKSGYGNKGKYSRKGAKDYKMKAKTTKKFTLLYKCSICGKMKGLSKGIRSGRIEIGEKVAK